jgi:hypothetical protein
MWKATTGMECPGCGTQRAFVRMTEGRPVDSFALFPALVPMFILFLLVPVQIKFAARISSDWVLSLFIVTVFIIFGSYFLRNLPV